MSIDLSGLSKAHVLTALYNNAALPPTHTVPNPRTGPMTVPEAELWMRRQDGRFDYVEDRLLRVDLSHSEFSPRGYDQANGLGLAQQVIDHLRTTGSTLALPCTTHAATDTENYFTNERRHATREVELHGLQKDLRVLAKRLRREAPSRSPEFELGTEWAALWLENTATRLTK
ncbi:hypothetical protein [Streptomyces sp. NPDC056707]|uniref:hypothetical protein n=1 Tax=Streptomyces sp. NPDC056707 TaxID=3345919 RepID=UPI003688537B